MTHVEAVTMDQAEPITFVGGAVLGDAGLRTEDLTLADGHFARGAGGRALRADGLWLLPGLVDLHGDGFERQLAPRRGVMTDLETGLLAVETELAAAGITTAWLAQFWSWEGGMRGPDFAQRFAAALTAMRPRIRLDLRMQLRYERTMIDDADAVLALVAAHGIDYLVFNDHIPHDRLAAGRPPPRLAGAAAKAGRGPEAHMAVMAALAARAAEVPSSVARMAAALRARGTRLGSHDDPDGAARRLWSSQGLDIAEFPLSQDAAEAARARGESVIMGAPNVVRGGSHKRGGLAAETLIAAGRVDALASDYHYPSLSAAAFGLAARGVLPLAEAWRLVSRAPASIMGLTDRGWIAEGLRADLMLYDPETRRIVGLFAGGAPVLLLGGAAARLFA
ncbi:MAG: alpha-D-ribose 1-methylphosphonate 5-triphosphate diphosphatase [Pseudomonadota bacterium]